MADLHGRLAHGLIEAEDIVADGSAPLQWQTSLSNSGSSRRLFCEQRRKSGRHTDPNAYALLFNVRGITITIRIWKKSGEGRSSSIPRTTRIESAGTGTSPEKAKQAREAGKFVCCQSRIRTAATARIRFGDLQSYLGELLHTMGRLNPGILNARVQKNGGGESPPTASPIFANPSEETLTRTSRPRPPYSW